MLIAIVLILLVILVVWGLLAVIGHLLTWVIVGLIAGALASRVVQGRGMGCLMDLVFGLAGALLGGLVIHYVAPSLLRAGGVLGLIQDIIVAFLGAVVVLGVARLVSPKRRLTGGRKRRLLPR
ncbi:MAG TPA: hypothetical protein VEK76_06390 [Candidatus Binatia bacterium]|nr:hypothetical protein [Candidatus Binatia bacterium]